MKNKNDLHSMLYIQEQTFDKVIPFDDSSKKIEFENCHFLNCDFSEFDFTTFRFIDCAFNNCNLSLAKLYNTALQNVTFSNCKMLGLHFDTCNPFGFSVSFNHCILNHTSFYKLKIKKTSFINSQLREADFSDCDLSHALFSNCDLALAIFDRTNIEGADLRTAVNFSIDPEKNKIKKAKFVISGLPGLLDKFDLEIEQ